MGADPTAELRAVAALVALLLLPGLTVVRAPWTAVPLLSCGFWVASWAWLQALGMTRGAFLTGALVSFAALASLRLLKPLPVPRVGPASALVGLAAAAQLLPLARLDLVPGADGPLRALSVRLLMWHDGLPRTYEPLAPLHYFGAAVHAVDLLAADVALLAGVPPALGALVAALAAQGLLLVALDALLTRALPPPAGHPNAARALSGAVVLAVAGLRAAAPGGPSAPTLGLALGVAAVALLWRGQERAPAVAAGVMLGAALAGDPLFTLAGMPLVLTVGGMRIARARDARRRALALRLALACAGALILAGPALGRSLGALSVGERARLSALIAAPEHLWGLAWVVAALLGAVAVARTGAWARLGEGGRAGLAAATLVATLGTAWGAARLHPRTPPTRADLHAFHALAAATSIDDVICIDAATSQVWIPALVGRAVSPAPLPGLYDDELRRGWARRRPCVPMR